MAAPAAEPASHQPRARCHSRDQRRSGNRETARRRGKLAGSVRCDAGGFPPLATLPPAPADAVRPESMCWSRRIRRGELALAEAPGRVPPGRRRSLAGTGARQERRPLGQSARAGGPRILDDASTGRSRCRRGVPGSRLASRLISAIRATLSRVPLGDLGHRNTSADLHDGPVPLLGHAQLPQHERECQASSEANVWLQMILDTPWTFYAQRRPLLGWASARYWPDSYAAALPWSRRTRSAVRVRCHAAHLSGPWPTSRASAGGGTARTGHSAWARQ
jgi:hypothetical protein